MSPEKYPDTTVEEIEVSVSSNKEAKQTMLATLVVNVSIQQSLDGVISQENNSFARNVLLNEVRARATKYTEEIITAIRQHINNMPTDSLESIAARQLAIKALRDIMSLQHSQFISSIIETAIQCNQPSHTLSSVKSVAFHAGLLLSDFCDNWLPINSVRDKLNDIAACVAVTIKAQSTNSVQTHIANPVLGSQDPLAPAEAEVPVASIKLPLPAAVPADLVRLIAPVSDAPAALPKRPVRSDRHLILGGAAIGLIGVALGFTQRERVITRSRHTISTATRPHTPSPQRNTNSIVPTPPPEATRERQSHTTPTPVIISASSAFGIEDLVHSRLEEGVRRALLTQTEALGHCLADPRDAVYLAHGLRRPITDQLRRANWQVGIAPGQRGVTITWTDNGRCNDFEARGWEINDAGTQSTIYPATIIVIATDIATIARNQKMFHVLPTISQ